MPFPRTGYELNIESLTPGDRIRVNHVGCHAGTDTRRRLYMERPITDPSKVIYWCHNCADGGAWSDKEFEDFRKTMHTKAQQYNTTEVICEPDIVTKVQDMPSYAQAHVIKNKLRSDWLEQYRLGYDPQSDRFYTPQYRAVTSKREPIGLEGYQLRLLHGTGPKYLTTQHPEFNGYTMMEISENDGVGVIVEDLISGIHVYTAMKDAGYAGKVGVNYGTKINTHLLWAMQQQDKVIVWLDNDSEYIRRQAQHIARTMTMYGVDADAFLKESDPKHHDETTILEAVHG